MSSPDGPEVEVAEQAREADPALDGDGELAPGLEDAIAGMLDRFTDADLPDDEVLDLH